ncbi:hypothetical protein AXF42_Ash004118 [Apostasia shenzhenica]|uniref:Uncharacterized protein n=1 Tax=Apostasia shenzhenica TaxID=1088818 RepID=A0A2I0A206_9ASPA|nr:hypothetical protein AXF42_Ash004118 [Apostasia shenzhenica]
MVYDKSLKSERNNKIKNKRKQKREDSNISFLSSKNGIKEDRDIKKRPRLKWKTKEAETSTVEQDHATIISIQNRMEKSKKRTKTNNEHSLEQEREVKKKNNFFSDVRFNLAHTDPRFQRIPKREAKILIDSRFVRMLSDRNFSSSAAPVDKRGKPRKSKEVNPLLRYYLHEQEPDVEKEAWKEEEEEEEDPEVVKAKDIGSSSEGSSDDSSSSSKDEDEQDDYSVNSDLCRYLMANHEDTPTIEQETHRLAVVNMDWDHIKSVDLFVVMSSCLPKGGLVLSVSIYPSEFGLKCMEVEALHGPTCLIDDGDGEQSEEEPDGEMVNEKLRSYELNKLRYYHAVAVFDSSATANHVYNTLDGTELTRTSNIFDLRFIPETMEFKHSPRDVTTEAPTSYKEPDFHTRALQHSEVKLTWEDDEPQRVKTLRRKFNAEKESLSWICFWIVEEPEVYFVGGLISRSEKMRILDWVQSSISVGLAFGLSRKLKCTLLRPHLDLDDLNEYLASTDDSDESEHGNPDEAENLSCGKPKKHGNVGKLRALLQSNGGNSDSDQSDNDRDMEITFNTGLEDLSKRILEKKEKKADTIWEQVLRKRKEKRLARKNRSKNSSDDDEGSDHEMKEAPDKPDDFFIEESSDANRKTGFKKSKSRVTHKKEREEAEEIEREQEASRAELELLFAEDQGVDKGPSGYNMKSKKMKGKKGMEIAAEEKLPNVDCSNDPRFAALFTNPLYALDPTDPQFKRSAAHARQRLQKQIGSRQNAAEDENDEPKQTMLSNAEDAGLVKEQGAQWGNEKHELSSMVKSLKRNLGNMKHIKDDAKDENFPSSSREAHVQLIDL